jgi:hypothetical protein
MTTQSRLPAKSDQDRLNELIEFYTKHKPEAGKVIQVRLTEDQLRTPHRSCDGTIERVGVEKR